MTKRAIKRKLKNCFDNFASTITENTDKSDDLMKINQEIQQLKEDIKILTGNFRNFWIKFKN